MKKFVLAVLFVASLVALGALLVREFDAAPTTAVPVTAVDAPVFALKLSRRLGAAPPVKTPPSVIERYRPAPELVLPLVLLASAGMLGLIFGALLRNQPRQRESAADHDPVALNAASEAKFVAADPPVAAPLDGRHALEHELQHAQHRLADQSSTLEELHGQLAAERQESATRLESVRNELREAHDTVVAERARSEAAVNDLGDQTRALAERDETIGQLRVQLTDQEHSLADAQALQERNDVTLAATHTELADAHERLRALENDLGDSREAQDEYEQALRVQLEDNTQLRADLSARESHIEALDTQLSEQARTLLQQEADLGERERDLQLRRDDMAALQGELGERIEQIASLEATLAQRSAELAQASATLEDHELALSRHAARNAELTTTIAEQTRQLESSGDSLREREQALAAHSQTIAEYEHNIGAQQRQLDDMEDAHAQLTARADALDTALKERDEALHEHAEYLAAARAEIVELSGYREKLASWDSTVQTLQRELRERDAAIVTLRADSQALEAVEERARTLADELALARAELNEQTQREAQLRASLDARTVSIDALEADLATARGRENALADELATATARAHSAEQRVAELASALAAVENHRDVLAQDLEQLLDAGQRDSHRIALLEREIEGWQDRLVDRDSELHQERNIGDALRDRLAALHDEHVALDNERAQTVQDLAEAHARIEAQVAEITQLQDAGARGEAQIAALHEQITQFQAVQSRLDGWQSTIDTFRNDVRHKTQLLDDLRTRHTAAEEEIATLHDVRDQAMELERQLVEKTRLTQVLKDGADAMLAHKETAERRKARITRLEHDLSDVQCAADEAIQALHGEQTEAATLRDTVSEQEQRIAVMLADSERRESEQNELAEQLRLAHMDVAALTQRADEYWASLSAMSDDLHGFAEHSTQITALLSEDITEIDAAAPDVDLGHLRAQSAATIAEMRAQLAAHDAAAQRLVDADQQLEREREITAVLRTEVQELAELREQLENAEFAMGAQEQAANDLQARLEKTESVLQDFERQRDTAAQMFDQLEALRNTNATLTVQLEALVADKQSAAADLDELTAHRTVLSEELASVVNSNASAQAQLSDVQRQRQQLQLQLEANAKERDALAETLALDRAENAQLYEEIERLEGTIQSLQDGLDDALKTDKALTEQVRQLANWENEATREIEQLRDATTQSKQLAVDVEQLTHRLREGESIMGAMLTTISATAGQPITTDNWRAALDEIATDLDNSKRRAADLTNDNVTLRAELANLQEKDGYVIAGLRAQIDRLQARQEDSDALRKERSALREALDAQMQRTRELQDTLAQRAQQLQDLETAATKLPEHIPVLRDALSAPPVLTSAVSVAGADEDSS